MEPVSNIKVEDVPKQNSLDDHKLYSLTGKAFGPGRGSFKSATDQLKMFNLKLKR